MIVFSTFSTTFLYFVVFLTAEKSSYFSESLSSEKEMFEASSSGYISGMYSVAYDRDVSHYNYVLS